MRTALSLPTQRRTAFFELIVGKIQKHECLSIVENYAKNARDKRLLTEETAYFTRKFGRNPEG